MSPHELGDVQAALVRSATKLVGPLTGQPGETSLQTRLARLTRAALDNVPGADLVGLTLQYRDGALQSYGQTGPDVAELDHLQVELEQGPCLQAIQVGTWEVIQVRDFAEDQRWQQFAEAALARGVHSLISFALAPPQTVPGAINFYSRYRDGFDQTAREIGGAFAMQAAIALYGAREIANLERALESRDRPSQGHPHANPPRRRRPRVRHAGGRLAGHQHETGRRGSLAHDHYRFATCGLAGRSRSSAVRPPRIPCRRSQNSWAVLPVTGSAGGHVAMSEDTESLPEPTWQHYTTADPERAAEVIRDSYEVSGGVRISGDAKGFHFSQDALSSCEFAITRFQCTFTISYQGPLDGLLTTFPNNAMHALAERSASGNGHADPAAIRRALKFVEADAHRPITLADIAEAARISPRGLQHAFRTHRDRTPLQQLKETRLARIHRDLQAADPSCGDTVAAIAARWGFAHAGRFSVEYRKQYGCSPRDTLHC